MSNSNKIEKEKAEKALAKAKKLNRKAIFIKKGQGEISQKLQKWRK